MLSQAFYFELFDKYPDAILVSTCQGVIVLWNKAMENITKVSKKEVIGQNISKFFSFFSVETNFYLNNLYSSNIEVNKTPVYLKFKDLEISTYYSISIKIIEAEEAVKVLTISKIPEDTCKEIRESEEKYRTIFSNSFIPAYVVDATSMRILEINEAFSDLYGFSPSDLGNLTLTQISLEPEETDEDIKKLLERKRVYVPIRYHKTKSGEKIAVEIYSGIVHRSGNLQIISLVNNISDRIETIDRLKNYALELETSNATKSRMFSIISHDLRGPVGNLKVIMEYLLAEFRDYPNPEIQSLIAMANESVLSIFTLLENLLSWAQNQWHQLAFSPKNVVVHDIIGQVVDLFSSAITVKEINLKLEYQHSIEIFADENMLSAILRNMLSNAIKFTKNKGEISIVAKFQNNGLCLGVRDSGVGISQADIAKIMDKSEIHTTYGTNNEKGSGLGINLCREFALKHGGQLHIESQTGKGTFVWVHLPV